MGLTVARVGEVYTFRHRDGRFGACQVIAEGTSGREPQVEVAALDYMNEKKPTLADAKRLRVLRKDWGSWAGEAARLFVPARVPWWAERVGALPVLETFEEPSRAYGFWQGALAAWHRESWKAREKAKATARPIELEGVTKHPTMEEYRYEGDDPRFVDYIVQRKILVVHWKVRALKAIDLSRSRIADLRLDVGDAPVTLHVPSTLEQLTLFGAAHRLTVTGGAFAFPFRLRIVSPTIVAPPKGAERVQSAEYSGLRDTDSAALTKYTDLSELTLRGAPGYLRDARGLAKLATLRELSLYELYALDVARWPASWPALDAVRIHGVEQGDGATLKKSLKAIGSVEIGRSRTAKWVEENLENPLRGWEDDNRAFGRAAGAAWKKAKIAAAKVGVKAKKADAKAILDTFVKTLNRLGEKHLIDTIRREEAADAYLGLARGMGVVGHDAEKWLDAARDF